MTSRSPIRAFLHAQARQRRGDLATAAVAGAAAAAAATLMLGLSGWFLAGAALAGAGGPAAVQAFNYLLPSAGLRGLAILRTAGRYGERLFAHRAALHALSALRPALFRAIAEAPPGKALALSGGEASARLVQDVDALETLFVRRPSRAVAAAAAIAAAAVIAIASPLAALAFLAGLALQILLIRELSHRITRAPAAAQLAHAGRLKEALGAYGPATVELMCFGLTHRAVDAIMVHDAEMGAAVRRRRDREASLDAVELLGTIALLSVVAALSAKAALPLLALAMLAAFAGQEAAAGVLRAARERGAADEAAARIDGVISETAAKDVPPPAVGSLRIHGATLQPGERVALVGPSGCGKTTLLETLLGLRPAEGGVIAVEGAALEDRPVGWARPLFAHAPQDARILTGTIRDNLRLGAPGADDDSLWEALADAQLSDRIEALPDGLDAWVGNSGEILSGGERRRLSLARALLRPAPWLILDEPTEGLDAATEAAVVQVLDARLRRTGQGLIVVGHRQAPLSLAQRRLAITSQDHSRGR